MLVTSNEGEEQITFSGTEEATIDDKNRLLISKKKREKLGENFVLALSEIGAIGAYPKATWQAMMGDLLKTSSINPGRQLYARLVVTTAVEDMNFDNQGRIILPTHLRQRAKIADKVMVAGTLEKVEIWAKDEWDAFNSQPDEYGQDRLAHISRALSLMAGV